MRALSTNTLHQARITLALGMVVAMVGTGCSPSLAGEKQIPIVFSGGHDLDPSDNGRPVVLVAAGLGVSPEVFRAAFRGVTPARDGKPSGDEARRNKDALLKVLAPHGVTNERLDEVSDYYRYQPQHGGLWKTREAKAHALVEDGKIKQIVVTEPGAGYTTPPKASLKGMEQLSLKVTVHIDKDLKKNGAVGSVELAETAKD